MAGTITHSWNGTVLTVTSDSGTSSMDLKGGPGDIGPRGPQGPAGISVGSGGSVDLTGYATEQYVDDKIAAIDASKIDLSNYYTKAETNAAINTAVNSIEPGSADLSNYYTKSEVDAKGYATETFVTTKIAEAQLSGGEGGNVDLSGYRTLDNNEFTGEIHVDNGIAEMKLSAWGLGSSGSTEFWIDNNGSGYFIGNLQLDQKPVATQEYVTQAINDALAALDGDEVSY